MRRVHRDITAAREQFLTEAQLPAAPFADTFAFDDYEMFEQDPIMMSRYYRDKRLLEIDLTPVPETKGDPVVYPFPSSSHVEYDDDDSYSPGHTISSVSEYHVALSSWNMDNEVTVSEIMVVIEALMASSGGSVGTFVSGFTVGEFAHYIARDRHRMIRLVSSLGFHGLYYGDVEYLRKKTRRVRDAVPADEGMVWFCELAKLTDTSSYRVGAFKGDEQVVHLARQEGYMRAIEGVAGGGVDVYTAMTYFHAGVWNPDIVIDCVKNGVAVDLASGMSSTPIELAPDAIVEELKRQAQKADAE